MVGASRFISILNLLQAEVPPAAAQDPLQNQRREARERKQARRSPPGNRASDAAKNVRTCLFASDRSPEPPAQTTSRTRFVLCRLTPPVCLEPSRAGSMESYVRAEYRSRGEGQTEPRST